MTGCRREYAGSGTMISGATGTKSTATGSGTIAVARIAAQVETMTTAPDEITAPAPGEIMIAARIAGVERNKRHIIDSRDSLINDWRAVLLRCNIDP